MRAFKPSCWVCVFTVSNVSIGMLCTLEQKRHPRCAKAKKILFRQINIIPAYLHVLK